MMHSSSSTPSSFSMLFSKPYDHHHHHHDYHNNYDQHDNYQFYHHDQNDSTYSFSNSGVDCTLSLGTPSTRLSPDDENDNSKRSSHQTRNDKRRSSDSSSSSSRVTNFCWDMFQPKHYSSNQQTTSYKNTTRGPNNSNNNNNNNNSNGNNNDPLVARRCANCDTTSTPLWRNGPRGPKSLCNACGIRFKKEERRATAAAANQTVAIDHQPSHVYGHHYNNQYHNNNNNSWNSSYQQYSHYSQPQKNVGSNCVSSTNDQFRFVDNDVDAVTADTGISFLSWRLNVTDRPSLVHDFTR